MRRISPSLLTRDTSTRLAARPLDPALEGLAKSIADDVGLDVARLLVLFGVSCIVGDAARVVDYCLGPAIEELRRAADRKRMMSEPVKTDGWALVPRAASRKL